MDMGMHVFHDLPEPKQLFQILVPGLEERARMLPKLSTAEQLSPGEQVCGATWPDTSEALLHCIGAACHLL